MAIPASRTSLLDLDHDLASRLPAHEIRVARQAVLVRVEAIDPGPWIPPHDWSSDPGALGVLLLDGFMVRDVVLVERHGGELLGRGDLLRPAEHDGEHAPLPFAVTWSVLERARVAIIDRPAANAIGRWPELVAALLGRAVRRAQWLAMRQAISQFVRIDARLLALFWHLADRWGHVESDGVVVPLRLTHEMIARIAGAQRPSVTIALGELAERGVLVRRPDRTWRLQGDPPEEVARLARHGQRGPAG